LKRSAHLAPQRAGARARVGRTDRTHGQHGSEGHAHRAYDVQSPTLVLVRPDGYIGLIAEGASTASVHDYLRLVFPDRVG